MTTSTLPTTEESSYSLILLLSLQCLLWLNDANSIVCGFSMEFGLFFLLVCGFFPSVSFLLETPAANLGQQPTLSLLE